MPISDQLQHAITEAEVIEKGNLVTIKVPGGQVYATKKGKTLKIVDSHLDASSRGRGLGVEMYVTLADYAKEHDLVLVSDSTVEEPAMRVWMALKRRGYKVKVDPRAVRDKDDEEDFWRVGDGSKYPVVKLAERRTRLDEGGVKKLRKDFLTLMKNLKRVDSFKKANQLRDAIRRWAGFYEEVLRNLQKQIKSGQGADYVEYGIDKAWSFHREVREFPLELSLRGRGYSDDDIFKKYEREVGAWEKRVRRKSRDAWKWFNEAAEYNVRVDQDAERGIIGAAERPRLQMKHATAENVQLEGFKVQFLGKDMIDSSLYDVDDVVSSLRRALRLYKRRAQRVLPLLLKRQLPLIVDFTKGASLSGAIATHEKTHIRIHAGQWATEVDKDTRDGVKTLAHEMGHHVYQTMRGNAQKEWDHLIKGGFENIDLHHILDEMKPGEKNYEFMDRIKRENPVLFLQLRGLQWEVTTKDLGIYSADSIRTYLQNGGHPIVRVNRHPITAYANKNPEEAFCEALGLLVGYGPATVHPEVRSWVKRFLPGSHFESLSDELDTQLRG